MLDLTLAVVHHVLIFGLVAMLAVERTLLRASTIDVPRLARLDAGYGLTAVLIIAIGVGRVIWGGKGWAFYEVNPFFWAKMAAFAGIGLLSAGPTLTFLRWNRTLKSAPVFQPPKAEIDRAAWALNLQLPLVVVAAGCAAAMARYPF